MAGKVMASIFWDAKGIIVFIDYLQKGKLTEAAACERQSSKNRPGKLAKGVLFHQDNAPAHKSVVVIAAVRDRVFELLEHPFSSSWISIVRLIKFNHKCMHNH